MSEANGPASAEEPRLSIGNPEVDRMLDGGLMPHRPYLLVGPSGTGKTTLALQFLCEGVRRGERTLLVTLEEPPNEVLWNHRALLPELGKVEVFDAIPDVMRYERTPFKDIAAVRAALPFDRVDRDIRRTPELTSVEVTISALEQMLRTEVTRKAYTRVVVDSLTALQYFCMKGYEPAAGAQSFLRFLSDLRVTTLLTVESPLEDIETPERMLARGEIRLFRWENEGVTVRAVGVEKFRGSSHDVRLHPYRIGARGLDVNLLATISRDTQEIIGARAGDLETTGEPALREPGMVELLAEEVHDRLLVGASVEPIQLEVEAALSAARQDEVAEAAAHLSRALAEGTIPPAGDGISHHTLPAAAEAALARILSRAESERVGVPPARLPEPPILAAQLSRLLNVIVIGTREMAERAPFPAPPPSLELEEPVGEPTEELVVVDPESEPADTQDIPEEALHDGVAAPGPSTGPVVSVEEASGFVTAPGGTGPEVAPGPAPVAPPVEEAVSSPLPPASIAPSRPPSELAPTTSVPFVPPTAEAPLAPSPPPSDPAVESAPALAAAPARAEAPPPTPERAAPPLPPPPPTMTPAPVVPSPPTERAVTMAPPPPRAVSHARPEPPPLPNLGPLAEGGSMPLPPPPSHSGPNAPAMPPVARGPATRSPDEPPPLPSIPGVAPPESKRRRRAAGSRRKGESPPNGIAGTPDTATLSAPTGLEPPAKPKRRVVRKKKAPPVVGATPGPVPSEPVVSEPPAVPPPVDPAPPTEAP